MKKASKMISYVLIVMFFIVLIPVGSSVDYITNSNGHSWSVTGSNIQLAINDLGSTGGTVNIPATTSLTNGKLDTPALKIAYSNIRIKGAGVDKTNLNFIGTYGIAASKAPGIDDSCFKSGVSNLRLDNFSFYGRGLALVIRSGCTLSDLKGYDIRSSIAGIRFICPYGSCTDRDGWTESSDAKSENINVINCHILRSSSHGFQLNAIKYKGCTFNNVLFKGCSSTKAGCWEWSTRSLWAVGFDLSEPYGIANDVVGGMTVQNLKVQNCKATEAWESGFHFEYRVKKSNIVFTDCVSTLNGQKYFRTSSSTWPHYVYGAGWMAVDNTMTFIRCTSQGNAAWGWSGEGRSNSPLFTNCIGDKYPTNSQGNGWKTIPKGFSGGLARSCTITGISSG
jgi:hypothetical protein